MIAIIHLKKKKKHSEQFQNPIQIKKIDPSNAIYDALPLTFQD